MSDYERINANVKSNIADKRHQAIKQIIAVLVEVLLALGALICLKAIGFISGTFLAILIAVAICVGTFKIGYISHDIKF